MPGAHPRLALLLGVLVAGCTAGTDRLVYQTEPSRVMGVALGYAVYTPPDFAADERLPLVVFLHGGGDDPRVFDRHGVADHLDREIRAGRVPRAVIVLPQGDNGFWLNWYDGSRRYRDWILGELVPEVRRRYHTRACPEHCHLMGVSMGGFGTLRYAVMQPDAFRSASVISAPIFDTEQMLSFARNRLYAMFIPVHRVFGPPVRARIENEDPFRRFGQARDAEGLRLLLAWGERDRPGIRRSNRAFVEHLQERDVPHEHFVFEGDHGWTSWTPVIARALAHQLAGHASPPGTR